MCGIFGIVYEEENNLGPILIEAGKRLSYRGYDSVGCATLADNRPIDLRKDVGRIEEVSSRLGFDSMVGSRGILQLRWATFGKPSHANAQPHLDSDGDLVGAHNGNVVNNIQLRQQFISEGMTVRSTNDGESCVHAVERYLDRGSSFIDAIRKSYQDLEGDYAFVIGRRGENELHAIRKGSGLVVGLGENFTCLSSDLPSLLHLTDRIIRVNDGEIVTLFPDNVELRSVSDGEIIERQPEIVIQTMEIAQKGGYAHYMLKEIYEQPQVATELIHLLDRSVDLDPFIQHLSNARQLYLVGCGTSYHACVLGSIFLARLAKRPAIPILAPQFIAQYGPTLNHSDVGIFVSQSGETKDVLNAVEIAQARGASVLGLVNVIGSSLLESSLHSLPLGCGYEISVPATKTYTNQVIAFLYMAMRMGGHETSSLNVLPDLIQTTLEATSPQIEPLIGLLLPCKDMYCLGYGLTYPIALEGALKLKEITYAHCEGMLSTEFKHGPLSAVRDGYPVLFVAGPEDVPLIISGINETTTRGGLTIAIGEVDQRLIANADHLVTIPSSDPHLNAVLSILPLQLLSYYLSVELGYDPDFPRNLSKTLTVD